MVSLPELAFLVLSDVINIITRVRFNITWFIIVCLPCSGNTMSWKTREICKPLLITLPPLPSSTCKQKNIPLYAPSGSYWNICNFISTQVSRKLPTYPSPKSTLTLTSQKCWVRGGVGGQFPQNPKLLQYVIFWKLSWKRKKTSTLRMYFDQQF